jgi:hypothetical protein
MNPNIPRLINYINYYKNFNLVIICIESLICFTCLLLLIIFSILYLINSSGNP